MLAIALLAAAATACSTPNPTQTTPNGHRAIEYQVEGIAPSLTITYSTFAGGKLGASTASDAKLPWKRSIEVPAGFKQAGLTAATGQANGDVTCRIVSGGKVLAENHSSGTTAVASCTANF
jgi:hypothetical protein